MTPSDKFIQILANILLNLKIWMIIKGLVIIGLGVYLGFAIIIIRQVGLMSKTLNGEFAAPIKLISWIHLLVALGVFLLALVIL